MLKSLIKQNVLALVEDAIYNELYASHLYKHLSNQCQRIGLFGAAKFFQKESADELTHYQKLADFLNDRGSVAKLPELPAINVKVSTLGDALQAAYNAEENLGGLYERWYSAIFPVDKMTANFLTQFLEIQMSSIGEYGDLLVRWDMINGNTAAILLMDEALGGD